MLVQAGADHVAEGRQGEHDHARGARQPARRRTQPACLPAALYSACFAHSYLNLRLRPIHAKQYDVRVDLRDRRHHLDAQVHEAVSAARCPGLLFSFTADRSPAAPFVRTARTSASCSSFTLCYYARCRTLALAHMSLVMRIVIRLPRSSLHLATPPLQRYVFVPNPRPKSSIMYSVHYSEICVFARCSFSCC